MTDSFRIYRSGKLVATANEAGRITVLAETIDRPYVEFPYIHESCRPVEGDETQLKRRWLKESEDVVDVE